MGHDSPDRPARFYQKWLGANDTEPPITNEEFSLFRQYRDGVRFVPADVQDALPPCPFRVNRETRVQVRQFVSDPRLQAVLKLIEHEDARDQVRRKQQDEDRETARLTAADRALQARLGSIDAFHDNQLNEIKFYFTQFQGLIGSRSIEQASTQMALDSYSEHKKNTRAMNLSLAQQGGGRGAAVFGVLAGYENKLRDDSNGRGVASELAKLMIRRSLVAMDDGERATLRMAEVLRALDVITDDDHIAISVPIVWNEGQCDIDFGATNTEFRVRAAMLEHLKPLMASGLGTAAGARERLNQAVRQAVATDKTPASTRNVIERYLFSGSRWMSDNEGQVHAAQADSPTVLRLGGFPGSTSEMLYDLRESLITVAPPGAGKTQAHVLRNLFYLDAPAVVLDIKGEMLRATRAWREEEVGKTYAFTPQAPDTSIHYNPIDGIRTDPELAWEDARRLADLLVVPASGKKGDEYFEARARDMITTAVLDVAISETGADRSMSGVLDRLYLSEKEKISEWCAYLKTSGIPQLARQAAALEGMPDKQREGIFDSARRQLEIWQSPAIARISADSTFNPGALRAEKATLYLAVALEDVKKFASVLRVLIGHTMAELYREPPETAATPVTFFLDELPRLGRMDVLEEALDAGRGYGVRLWMFCQNIGQLEIAYPNAQGMMSNCAVRCFMNPDEDTAQWISKNLGQRHGLLDGNRKALVEPHQLTGTDFADQLVVFSRGQPPARLDKKPAYNDPVCRRRELGEDTTPKSPIVEAIATDDAAPTQKPAPAVEEATSWDDLKAVSPPPAAVPQAIITPSTATPPKRLIWLGASLATTTLLALGWGFVQSSEVGSLRKEVDSWQAKVSGAQAAANAASGEHQRLINYARAVEKERDAKQATADTANSELQREKAAHAATRRSLQAENANAGEQQRLLSYSQSLEKQRDAQQATVDMANGELQREKAAHATTQRQLQAERDRANGLQASLNARAVSPPAPTVAAPPPQPVAVAPPPIPATATAPSSPFPQVATAGPVASLPLEQRQAAAPSPSNTITDCDNLAANPNDARRIGPGVKFGELRRNAAAALEACDRALASNPGELRFLYQKARTMHALRDMRVVSLLDQLINNQYAAAFDNAAQLKADQGQWPEADALYRRGVALNDPDAMVALADKIQAGKIPARVAGEDQTLYERAANAGHEGARIEVERRRQAANSNAVGAAVGTAVGDVLYRTFIGR
ncbi:type IV secretory system conjugative DNA transfer family protein [Tardiphaga sp. 803_E3_N1_3]|uniref:type IV secretory system conjugative DNA transfer family protein n=1 Tax=Tardiphaga sp. 803_E3_N1_3 TaxID=3240785 RepID=UPI003F21C7CC